MKKPLACIALALIASIPLTAAASSMDTGTIVELFATPTGALAIRLSNNFDNATSSGQCTASTGWAGVATADPFLKATLLTAKATDQTIRVEVQGCEGSWWKIISVYVE